MYVIVIFLPYKIMIATNYKISYFGFNFNWKSAYVCKLMLQSVPTVNRWNFRYRNLTSPTNEGFYIFICSFGKNQWSVEKLKRCFQSYSPSTLGKIINYTEERLTVTHHIFYPIPVRQSRLFCNF